MRREKVFTQVSKRIYHPEVRECLECGTRLKRVMTLSKRTVVTLQEVVKVVHFGYRCPVEECAGRQRFYRSREADALALPGFTFGLDIVLFVGRFG
jgi:hypothetical protein